MAPAELIGASGRCYLFKELIQERPHLGRVWLATSGRDKFVLKDIPQDIFSSFNEHIRTRLRESQYLRLPSDAIPDQRIFVYKYFTHEFLSLLRNKISMQARKQILKDSLRGIAELHDQDIVHIDIKLNNIMANCRQDGEETIVEQVQITDLKNAAYLPKGSPEAHFKGDLNKITDLFSFGAVCIYAVLGRVIFGPDDEFQKHIAQGALAALIRLQRQVSYFGCEEGLNGLMKHVGDEEVNCQILRTLWEERTEDYIPYEPFSNWPDVSDATFKNLIQKLMDLDPKRRITARQALEHPWFAG
ncbi:putative serine/threonine protein kinase [Corynespora cassiicola Philippines]|uniref:Putative serine/threonine protein kinase n=1 Tax=Corynespora cassiicola Philippines TaxID=1448308 RepID=A0A2T2NW98_CORCC|nr:putative serine/threonine protein kinase [Corynespora cassiicola Philippines]